MTVKNNDYANVKLALKELEKVLYTRRAETIFIYGREKAKAFMNENGYDCDKTITKRLAKKYGLQQKPDHFLYYKHSVNIA